MSDIYRDGPQKPEEKISSEWMQAEVAKAASVNNEFIRNTVFARRAGEGFDPDMSVVSSLAMKGYSLPIATIVLMWAELINRLAKQEQQ